MGRKLDQLLRDVRACQVCAASLPHAPRPVIQVAAGARVAIIGQAPGSKVHASGVPWQDPSGDHLREWLAMDDTVFYDATRVALVPMGFCYPGKGGKGGDAPPRPECAPLWHERLLAQLGKGALRLLVGQYAHKHYLGSRRGKTLTDTVQQFRDYLDDGFFALPHPSWRSRLWMQKHPWFEAEVLPELRSRIAKRV